MPRVTATATGENFLPSHLKTIIKAAAVVAGVAMLAALVFVLILVFPSTPKSSAGLRFAGFVPLPKPAGAGALSVLDYLTIDGRNMFVTSESSGGVYRVNLAGDGAPPAHAVDVLTGAPSAHGVAIDPVSHLAFASHSDSDTVDVFDPNTLKIVKRIPVDGDVDGIFYQPDAKLIYAVHGDPQLATLIDPANRAVVGKVHLGGKPEFAAYDPRTRLIFQAIESRGAMAEVDLLKRAVVGSWPLRSCESPTSVVLDELHRRLFVACAKNAQLVVVDPDSHRVIAALPVGGGPDSVAYDARLGRLYATGKSGVLTVIQQDSADAYRVVDNVSLHYGAHTLAFDPATGRLFVAYASLFVAPRLAVFQTAR